MAIGVSASCVVASSSCIALSCAQLLHAMLPNHCPATCCQRRAARTGNGTRDALLNAAFGCRTNCLRDPQNAGRIRRPSTTNSEGANVARERNVAKPSSLSLHTHCAVAAVVRHEVVPRHRVSLLLVVLRTSWAERASRGSCRARYSFLS